MNHHGKIYQLTCLRQYVVSHVFLLHKCHIQHMNVSQHIPCTICTNCHRCQIWLHAALALLRGDVFSFFFTFRKTVVCPPCSGLVGVLQSEERPDRQLMLYASMVEQSLLLQLLQLLGVEAEGVRPQVRPCVDERGTQRLSGEGVHKWRL